MEYLKISNLKKPSNKKLKRWADTLLYCLPLYLGAILASPMDDTWKSWLNFIITVIVVSFKAVTKFTADGETPDQE